MVSGLVNVVSKQGQEACAVYAETAKEWVRIM
jgi:hypothetical protein